MFRTYTAFCHLYIFRSMGIIIEIEVTSASLNTVSLDGHIALHNTNLYGTLVRSYSLGCCSQSSVEASGLNLFMYKLFGLVHICCHLGLYTLGHLGLYIFVAIWACTVWAIWACTYLLPFGPLHGRQITIIM